MYLSELEHWTQQAGDQHIILGYGSLMSADSRLRFSGIKHTGIPVHVKGYRRAWITRSQFEKQTYLGASPSQNDILNAQLIPVTLNPALADREKDYQFEEVSVDAVDVHLAQEVTARLRHWLAKRSIWICRTLESQVADSAFPVSQTYVDTCLAGCLEHGGEREAIQFIQTTKEWPDALNEDRRAPAYPRAATLSSQMHRAIDEILERELWS